MRYLKATLVGLLGGFLLAVAVTAFEFAIVQREMAASMQCVGGSPGADRTDYICDSAVQFGNVRHLEIVFLVGFAAASMWFLRRRRLSRA